MLTRTGAYLFEQRRANRLTAPNLPPTSGTPTSPRVPIGLSDSNETAMPLDGLLEKIVQALAL